MEFISGKYKVRLLNKKAMEELIEIQKLRYQGLLRDYNPDLPEEGTDDDGYDDRSNAIIVIDTEKDKIVGTYRITSIESLKGKKFKTEKEFNIDSLRNADDKILELGRAVVDKEYRDGPIIDLLWSGIFKYCMEFGYRYLFGMCSLHGQDPTVYNNVLAYLNNELICNDFDIYAIKNAFEYPINNDLTFEDVKPEIPPLLKAYLRFGVKISRNGYIDKTFNCCDIITVLDIQKMNERYLKRFLR